MKNSEKLFEVQGKLFEAIQKKLPEQYALVNIVSEVLGIGTDSAYRRIRCDKQLSIEETRILCRHFQISFDTLTDVGNIHQFDCIYRPINLSVPNEYYDYMLALSKRFEQLRTSSDSNILMSTTDIPIFHFITQKELTFFKLFTWTQSVYNYNGSIEEFMKKVETPELLACYRKINSSYSLIPSIEIWTDNTIHTTLKLISYYVDICFFSDKALPTLLCEQMLTILDRLQKWTESGIKGEKAAPFQLYISEMELGNTYILMKQAETLSCIVKLFTINSLTVFDKEFCKETENWLTKLKQRSVLLCGNSERERIKFFNSQRQMVRFLMEKINKYFNT